MFDFDGDGDADRTDETIITNVVYSNQFAFVPITDSYYDADCDSNRNGVVDEEDLGAFTMASALDSTSSDYTRKLVLSPASFVNASLQPDRPIPRASHQRMFGRSRNLKLLRMVRAVRGAFE